MGERAGRDPLDWVVGTVVAVCLFVFVGPFLGVPMRTAALVAVVAAPVLGVLLISSLARTP
jgi:hypothetical protein